MSIRAVVFDLDDTLYDEITFVRGAMREVAAFLARRVGESEHDLHDLLLSELDRSGRGRVFDRVLTDVGLPGSLVPTLVYVYRSARPPLQLFYDAGPLLDGLRATGVRLGVLTDGSALVQGAKVDLLGLRERVEVVVLTDAVGPGTPKPDVTGFQIACDLLEVEPSATAYVANDLRKDVVGPRKLGMRAIHVTRRQLGTLAGLQEGSRPDDVVGTLADVRPLITPRGEERPS